MQHGSEEALQVIWVDTENDFMEDPQDQSVLNL